MIKAGLLLSLPLLAMISGLAGYGWIMTPEGVLLPVHWNSAGEVDGYGGRVEAFLILPGIAIALTGFFAIAPLIDPRGRNLARSPSVFLIGWIGSLVVLACVQTLVTLSAVGVLAPSSRTPALVVGGACALLLAGVGNVLGKARPNWFVGVRSPWTLSSDMSWDLTHRWTGRAFVLVGLIALLLFAFGQTGAGFAVIAGGAVLSAAGAVILSYLIWRRDPNRETFSADKGGEV